MAETLPRAANRCTQISSFLQWKSICARSCCWFLGHWSSQANALMVWRLFVQNRLPQSLFSLFLEISLICVVFFSRHCLKLPGLFSMCLSYYACLKYCHFFRISSWCHVGPGAWNTATIGREDRSGGPGRKSKKTQRRGQCKVQSWGDCTRMHLFVELESQSVL